jgi:hypothetical protein
MAVDRYTKGVLTVIAASLLWLCAMTLGLPLSAQQFGQPTAQMINRVPAQPVVIVGWGTMDPQGQVALSLVKDANGVVHTDTDLAVRLRQNAPIPVSLSYTVQQPLPVGITGVKAGTDWEPIRVKAEPQPPEPMPGPAR